MEACKRAAVTADTSRSHGCRTQCAAANASICGWYVSDSPITSSPSSTMRWCRADSVNGASTPALRTVSACTSKRSWPSACISRRMSRAIVRLL